jgi:hypothetical protein
VAEQAIATISASTNKRRIVKLPPQM